MEGQRQAAQRHSGDSRAAAITALAKWLRTQMFPDRLLADGQGQALEITYGVIRNKTALEHVVSKFCRKPPSPLPRAALLAGAWQLLFADGIPDYAAISETVDAARSVHAGSPGFVNAVLRAILRSRDALRAELAAAPLPLRASHPEEIVQRWTTVFGGEAAADICAADNLVPATTAVALPFSDAAKTAGLLARWKAAGIDAAFSDANPAAITIPHGVRIETLPGFSEGAFIIQDPATLQSLRLLAPKPGESILDACAAPGGKAMQLAASVGKTGRVFAFDASVHRLGRLRANAARTGFGDVISCGEADATTPAVAAELRGAVPDAILADVPCSNSGVFRRRPDARWRWTPGETTRLATLQLAILTNLATLGAGRLVYSTCSIDPEEDEDVVRRFLESPSGTRYQLADEVKTLPSPASDGSYAALLLARQA